jgi:hypothetical protein
MRRHTASRACFDGELQHGAPQLCADTVSFWRFETIDMDDTFNHVSHRCSEGPICDAHRNNPTLTIATTPDAAIDPHDSWRAAKARHNKI